MRLVSGAYSGHWVDIGPLLAGMEISEGLTQQQGESLRSEATKFLLVNGPLFKIDQPPKRVGCNGADQQ